MTVQSAYRIEEIDAIKRNKPDSKRLSWYPRILVVIPTLKDDPQPILSSLKNQTLKPTKIVFACGSIDAKKKAEKLGAEAIYVKPPNSILVAPRVINAINEVIKRFQDFDYLLRLDCDWRLPKNCIATNFPAEDKVNFYGPAIFISKATLDDVFDGRFPLVESEAVLLGILKMKGIQTDSFNCPPIDTRPVDKAKPWKYWFACGQMSTRNGASMFRYPFSLTLKFIREKHIGRLFELIGFLSEELRSH